MIELRRKLREQLSNTRKDVRLTYITSRGLWYLVSWKGQVERSGGLATNIGIHFFDIMMWLFGDVKHSEVHYASPTKTGGFIELNNARVQWYLSIDADDLPPDVKEKGQATYRSITMDGEEIEFSGGFTDLHTVVYKETLAGNGFGLEDARPSIELVHGIRNAAAIGTKEHSHPHISRL